MFSSEPIGQGVFNLHSFLLPFLYAHWVNRTRRNQVGRRVCLGHLSIYRPEMTFNNPHAYIDVWNVALYFVSDISLICNWFNEHVLRIWNRGRQGSLQTDFFPSVYKDSLLISWVISSSYKLDLRIYITT